MSTASQRLEQSRLAILEDIRRRQEEGGPLRKAFRSAMATVGLQRDNIPRAASPSQAAIHPLEVEPPALPDADNPPAREPRQAHERSRGRLHALGDIGRSYWQNHPARLAVELATPALSSYAQQHPARFLALSAGAGAALYLARPWRLVSVTGLAVAALRSPQVSGALISALYDTHENAVDIPHDVHPS